MPAITAVAKGLLEEQVFSSSSKAKLRYPDLFPPPKTQKAERATSEAIIPKLEAEAAKDLRLISDDEQSIDSKSDDEHAKLKGIPEDRAETPEKLQPSIVEM